MKTQECWRPGGLDSEVISVMCAIMFGRLLFSVDQSVRLGVSLRYEWQGKMEEDNEVLLVSSWSISMFEL